MEDGPQAIPLTGGQKAGRNDGTEAEAAQQPEEEEVSTNLHEFIHKIQRESKTIIFLFNYLIGVRASPRKCEQRRE